MPFLATNLIFMGKYITGVSHFRISNSVSRHHRLKCCQTPTQTLREKIFPTSSQSNKAIITFHRPTHVTLLKIKFPSLQVRDRSELRLMPRMVYTVTVIHYIHISVSVCNKYHIYIYDFCRESQGRGPSNNLVLTSGHQSKKDISSGDDV
jgi:hypothetical protein